MLCILIERTHSKAIAFVDALQHHVGKEQVRVASIAFSRTATLEFDFASLDYDAGAIRDAFSDVRMACTPVMQHRAKR